MSAVPWTDARVDAELREFLADRQDWPSYREFVAAGKGRLREEITSRGGERRWARRAGVRWRKRSPGYATRWTEERVRAELEEFLAGREVWPSHHEFERAGRTNLRAAVTRLGGVERWARELGLSRRNLRSGSRQMWDERRIERAVRPLVRRLGRWPTPAEFERAGLSSALSAMYRRGGIVRWQKRLGVKPARRPARQPRIWTDERIEAELREFCAGRTRWPTWHEFLDAGNRRLYGAASLHGGVEHWRERLGLKPPRRRYVPPGSGRQSTRSST
jgi:hypothetical protein